MKSRLFSPLQLRGVATPNRIVAFSFNQHTAVEGLANDWHLVTYGKFAQAGVGTVMVETAAVEARGRGSYGDLGLWSNEQVAPLSRIASFIKSQGAVPAIQIGHAGRKASMQRPWEGNGLLSEKEAESGEMPWQTLAPSGIPVAPRWPTPAAMNTSQIEEVASAFEAAARRAARAGFELLAVDCAQGQLLHQFLIASANLRSDAYGGSAERRRAYPFSVLKRIRAVWPSDKPLMCRMPFTEGPDGSYGVENAIEFARDVKAIGIDVIVRGGVDPLTHEPGAGQQLGRSPGQSTQPAELRKSAGIAVVATSAQWSLEVAEDAIATRQADLIGISRQLTHNPNWALHARAQLEEDGFAGWPQQDRWWQRGA